MLKGRGKHETTPGAVSMHGSHDYAVNMQKYCQFIEEATARRVEFLIFPEASVPGYFGLS
jgi:predicted amidohydrolase